MSCVRLLIASGLLAAAVAPLAQAQQVYRIVGPDGRVTFSDRPPAEANAKASTTTPGGGSPANALLPFELRQVANKYPVTLYTGANCGPCGTGRALLTARGIPFAEKTVSTPEDAEALQRLSADNSLPLLTIGSQQVKGFSDTEWTQFLDAAGYPKTSMLPPSYRTPSPTPLVAVQRPAAAEAPRPAPVDTATRPSFSPTPTSGPTPSNPAGIQF